MKLDEVRTRLRVSASEKDAANLQRYFKTGPGEYGAGDRFLGIRVPAIRKLVRQTDALAVEDIRLLIHSAWHEERLLALLILVRRYQRGEEALRGSLFEFYCREIRWINNWDLVDLSAPHIVGHWLLNRPRDFLHQLAASPNLWERRIAVLATLAFIRMGDFADTIHLCRALIQDPHDLIHKACGWMLREVGKRDEQPLNHFLKAHTSQLPRTMLRYAIERLPATQRQAWMSLPAGR
jgi:3-methyladenine DNA glycosylase AlkD